MDMYSGKKHFSLRFLFIVMLTSLLIVSSLPLQADAASINKSNPKLNYNNCISLYDGVQLQWSKVKGAKKYEVFRAASQNGKYKKIAVTKKTTIKLSAGKSNGDFYYKVRAVKGRSKSKWSQKIHMFAQSAQIIGMDRATVNYITYTVFTVNVNNRTNKQMYFNGYGLYRNANYSLYMVNASTGSIIAGRPGNAILNCSSGMAKIIPANQSRTIEIWYPENLARTTLREDNIPFLITASFYPNGKGPAFAIACTDQLSDSGGAGRIVK